MMSAETLRKAAALMREDAQKATPGRWKLWGMTVMADQDGTSNVDTAVEVAHTCYRDEHGKPRTFDADYIANWQPAVALAVADLIENEASLIDSAERYPDLHFPLNGARVDRLLAVARAYLQDADA